MKSIGSMDVECMAKPFKHCILTKDRNAPSNEKGIVLFRAGQILKHIDHAPKAIKGKVYGGVVNSDCDLAEKYLSRF
jgi:hypothetical protein